MKNSNYAACTRSRVDTAQTGLCSLYLAANVECSVHRISDIHNMYTANNSAMFSNGGFSLYSKTAITLDFTGYTDDIAQTLRCMLNLGANVEYITQKFIVISALETEIRRFEYLSLNMQNCNFAGFRTVQS